MIYQSGQLSLVAHQIKDCVITAIGNEKLNREKRGGGDGEKTMISETSCLLSFSGDHNAGGRWNAESREPSIALAPGQEGDLRRQSLVVWVRQMFTETRTNIWITQRALVSNAEESG